jgi:hypothetical protein
MLLLQRDALPAIEHLSVTNEQVRTASPLRRNKPIIDIQLSEHYLRQIADGTRLRSLLIRYITLGDVNILLGSLTMFSLEKLTLVDLFDHSKSSINEMRSHSGFFLSTILDLQL